MRFTIIIAAVLPLLVAALPNSGEEAIAIAAREAIKNPFKPSLQPHCDASADRSCVQNNPCKSGHYEYKGNHPYQQWAIEHCVRICECQ